MEASGGTAPASADTGSDSGTEGGGDSASIQESIQRVNERLDQVLDGITAEDYDDYDYDYDEDSYEDEEADESENALERLLQEKTQSAVQRQVEPWVRAQEERQRVADIRSLLDKHPDMRERADEIDHAARALADSLGDSELALEAPFLETVYYRLVAEERSKKEREAAKPGSEVSIEKGSGGNPGPSEDQVNQLKDRIVGAGAKKLLG